MPEVSDTQRLPERRSRRRTFGPAPVGVIAPPCRYRREFAGFHVCQATNHVAIVTEKDCGRCPVPETIESVDCLFLRARIELAPTLRVQWACGATDDLVVPHSDCFECL